MTGQGALWASGSYVWNPPGDDLPVALYASDVSGICSSNAIAGPEVLNGPSEPRDSTVWQQCPNPVSWSFNVDTRSQVPTERKLPNRPQRYERGRGGRHSQSKSVSVDNDPVGVSFRTPNDPNPSVWVNHAVTVDATPSAGPSGVGGMNCSIDHAAATSYPAGGLTVNGDGVHSVTCTAWNQAVDPQGQPNTGTDLDHDQDRRVAAIVELPGAESRRSDGAGGGHERQRIWCRRRLDRDGPGRHQRLDAPSNEL